MSRLLASAQIRAARALLRWTTEQLAERSGVGVATVRRAERSVGPTSLNRPNDAALRQTLEAAGVDFIDENGGGVGVRLREPSESTGQLF